MVVADKVLFWTTIHPGPQESALGTAGSGVAATGAGATTFFFLRLCEGLEFTEPVIGASSARAASAALGLGAGFEAASSAKPGEAYRTTENITENTTENLRASFVWLNFMYVEFSGGESKIQPEKGAKRGLKVVAEHQLTLIPSASQREIAPQIPVLTQAIRLLSRN